MAVDIAESRELKERVVEINRVAKVVKGGRRFSFTALVVVGDGNGNVGLGYGKAKEVPAAIQKGMEEAKKNLFAVPLAGSTITHQVMGEHDAARGSAQAAPPGADPSLENGGRRLLRTAGRIVPGLLARYFERAHLSHLLGSLSTLGHPRPLVRASDARWRSGPNAAGCQCRVEDCPA